MQPPNRIHVNPKFKSAHINPNFLLKQKEAVYLPPRIHINPNFILGCSPVVPPTVSQPLSATTPAPSPENRIVQKTLRKIIRKPEIRTPVKSSKPPAEQFTKIGKNKLVRVNKSPVIVKSRFEYVNKTNSDRTIVKKYFLCRTPILAQSLKKLMLNDVTKSRTQLSKR